VITISAEAAKDSLRVRIDGDFNQGEVIRSEGGKPMRLVEPVLEVHGGGIDYSAIHPDILALIGVLAFHPVLPTEEFNLHFDFPVSDRVSKALVQPYIVPSARITGSRPGEPYMPRREAVLSYGGGIDSLSAHLLLPGIPRVHETPAPKAGTEYEDVVTSILSDDPTSHVVSDNLRNLYSIWGLPLWVSVYVSSLVTQPRYIFSGSEMTGTYLDGGKGYRPRYQNRWYDVFRTIGVDVLPTSFLSEIGNARMVHHHGRMGDAAYCTFIRQKDCDRCTKCLRRRVIRAMLDSKDEPLVENFQRSEQIDRFLAQRPLYYGDIFTHALASSPRQSWVHDHVGDLVRHHGRIPFHDAYYAETFDHFRYPAEYREVITSGLKEAGLAPFTPEQFSRFQSYKQLPS